MTDIAALEALAEHAGLAARMEELREARAAAIRAAVAEGHTKAAVRRQLGVSASVVSSAFVTKIDPNQLTLDVGSPVASSAATTTGA